MTQRTWGILPTALRQQIWQREWQNRRRLRALLSGERAKWPISYPLKPPTSAQALTDIVHFRQFQQQWHAFPLVEGVSVDWETRQYQHQTAQRVPCRVHIHTIQALLSVLGEAAIKQSQHWDAVMSPLLALDSGLYAVLIQKLELVDELTLADSQRLAHVLPQLQAGLGHGAYLRALPIQGADSKFIETHQVLLSALLDHVHDGAISASGGLLAWLDCQAPPKDWLWLRPLCSQTQAALAGLPLLRLAADTLLHYPLPAARVLVVENTQTGYALPNLPDTIAVFGGGRNVSWLAAPWLREKQLGYWGDLDTWGLQILSEARRHQPQVCALAMDQATWQQHQAYLVVEPNPCLELPELLTAEEAALFRQMLEAPLGRLEQERLHVEYVRGVLWGWVGV